MSKITIDRAVVEQALEALNASMPHNNNMNEDWPSHIAARRALRAALEQPQVEQEPVAWIERWYGSGPERGWWIVCGRDHIAHLGPAEMSGEAASKIVSAHNTSPPAQRQPLTDQVIQELADEGVFHANVFEIVRRIEEEHGIFKLRAQGIGGEK